MAMHLVAMVGKQKDDGVVRESVALQRSHDLPDMFIGFEQAIVVMGNFFADERNIGIVGRDGHGGAVDDLWNFGAQFSARQLDLAEEGLVRFAAGPFRAIHGPFEIPDGPYGGRTAFSDSR